MDVAREVVGVQSAAWRRQLALGAGVATVSVLVWSALTISGMGATSAMIGAAVLSGLAAALAARPVTPAPAALPPAHAGRTPADLAPADLAIGAETLRQLRHDLRGILSPALMTADRLLMSTEDPVARRAAETMVETIERAEKRLAG